MASSVIGALRVMLGMDTAEFEKGATRATREANRMQKKMQKVGRKMQGVGAAITAGLTVPIVGAATAFAANAQKIANESREIAKSAQVAGEGFEEFQRQAFAADKVGVEFEKLGDIFKDVRDRVGDFVATGGGPMADFFENIAPKVGVTAEAFKGLSGKQALQLYYDKLREANVSQEEMVFYLEAMASDTTNLIPLLEDGGKAFEEFGKQAKVITEEDRQRLEKYKDAQDRLGQSMQELTIAFVNSGLLESLTAIIDKVAQFASSLSKSNPGLLEFGLVAGGIAAAIGPVLMALGSLVQMAPVIAGAFGAISVPLAPIAGVLAAVAGAGYLIYQNWEKIAPVLGKVRDSFVEALGPRITKLVETVKSVLTTLWEGPLGDLLRMAGEALAGFGETALGVFGEIVPRVLSALLEIVTTTFEQIGNVVDFFARLLTGDFSGAWQAAGRIVDTAVRGLVNLVTALFPEIETHVRGLYLGVKKWLQDKLGAVMDWVRGKIEQVEETFAWLYDKVVGNSWIPDMVEGIGQVMGTLQQRMVDPAQRAANDTSTAFEDASIRVQGSFEQMAEGALGSIDRLLKGIRSGGVSDILGGLLNLGSAFGVFGGGNGGGLLPTGGVLPSGGGGFDATLPGFANGGSMRLGGLAGIDRNLLSMNGSPIARVSRGEVMDIRPANDGGAINVTVTMDESTGALGAFVRNESGKVVAQAAAPIAQQGAAEALGRLRQVNRRRLA